MRDAALLFKGLADSTRLRILGLLLHGELCVCDIQHVLGAPQPNVSRHLNYLRNSGLVLDRRDGPRIFYRLVQPNAGPRRHLFQYLRELSAGAEQFKADSRKLRQAIESGSCTVSAWRPFSAVRKSSSAHVAR